MIDEFRYPLIVKPRVGGGSRFVMNVKNAPQLRAALEIVPLPIIQECIGTNDSEYTAGTYRASSGEIYTIVMKRRLKFGMTNSAEVVFDANLTAFCRDVIGKSGLRGANNLQFRLDKEGLPKMLEVNPRFSGTSGMRAHFGFNELKLWLSDLFLPTFEEPTITKGKVLRYMEEMYLDEE
jgi:carbamoyl-phosphate synthase large subunit